MAEEVKCRICGRVFITIDEDICKSCVFTLDPQTLAVHTRLRALEKRLDKMDQLISNLKGGLHGID